MEIILDVMDYNMGGFNALIGSHSVGLATLYRSMNHEFFNKWVPLMHPDMGSEAQGYLLISCYVIAKGDNPPVHGLNEQIKEDEFDEYADISEDELTPEMIRARKERLKNVAILDKPQIVTRGY